MKNELITKKEAKRVRAGARVKAVGNRIKEIISVALFTAIFIGLWIIANKLAVFIQTMTLSQLKTEVFCILIIICAGMYIKTDTEIKGKLKYSK